MIGLALGADDHRLKHQVEMTAGIPKITASIARRSMVRLAKSSGEYRCACVGAEAMALTHSSASDSTSDFRLMIVAPTSRVPFQSHHTSKPDVARRRIHRLRVARGGAVPAAIA